MVSKACRLLCLIVLLAPSVQAREPAPPLGGMDLATGQHIQLEDYRGKVVYVDFWASWCPPCLLSLPAYEKMRREIGTGDFEIIAVNVDERTEDGLQFLEAHPVSYPVIADPVGAIGIPYGVRTLPVSFLLDREGRIVWKHNGFRGDDGVMIKQRILDEMGR